MTAEQAIAKYKGFTVKVKGYNAGNDTQLIYKSELQRNKSIICLFIAGEVKESDAYLLPDTLKELFRRKLEGEIVVIPGDIKFDPIKERFSVPAIYFEKLTEAPKVEEFAPLKDEFAPLKEVTLSSGTPTVSTSDAKPTGVQVQFDGEGVYAAKISVAEGIDLGEYGELIKDVLETINNINFPAIEQVLHPQDFKKTLEDSFHNLVQYVIKEGDFTMVGNLIAVLLLIEKAQKRVEELKQNNI